MSRSALADDILDRFLRYVAIDTMSDGALIYTKHPTTDGQMVLLRLLEKELTEELGIKDVTMDPNGIVIAKIPGNCSNPNCLSIALMAHVDTASAVMGNGVKARVIESYDNKDILLGDSRYLTIADNPELLNYEGETLIVTDGTTLLGGDDKAGIAQIMGLARLLTSDPSIQHGPVELYFTSDEEVDCGMDYFPYAQSTCTWCYTVDGEKRYPIDTECFNAAANHVVIEGISFHLGAGRGKIVNAVTVASALVNALPQAESPEATDERYGYYCPLEIKGTLEKASVDVYVRDFDLSGLNRRIETVKTLAKTMESLYPGAKISVETTYQYYNFAEEVKKDPRAMELVRDAGRALNMPLVETLIRGGTDGAWMAQERKIPCLNLFAGTYNRHSVYEWVALPAMEDGSLLMLKMLELATNY